ncbi:recombinase family protein [Yimella sp. RIT 621]|uniref:recombinase family protein n=1 Tax=Yimella sp. RIT 621 TaxID=2510323 RepID=UPI00101B8DE0|nr:recombinase family protein [Yimella sp. RIT 621]RYG75837.1 recombinase family protein [Yimella sp. RIT 621]
MSTLDQDAAMQLDALQRAGIAAEHIVTDHASGTKQDRPGLNALLAQLKAGDVLTVWKLDRLGRSLSHLIAVVDELRRREIEFRSITEAIDTTTPAGTLLFNLVGAVAQFERDITAERTKAALAAARASGKPLGRPSRVNRHQYALIHQMNAAGERQATIAATVGLSRAVVGRVIRGEIASLTRFDDLTEGPKALPMYEPNA